MIYKRIYDILPLIYFFVLVFLIISAALFPNSTFVTALIVGILGLLAGLEMWEIPSRSK